MYNRLIISQIPRHKKGVIVFAGIICTNCTQADKNNDKNKQFLPGIYRYTFGFLQLQAFLEQPLGSKQYNITFTMAAAVQQQQRGSKTTTRTMNGTNSKTNSNNRRRGTSLLSDSGKLLLLDLKGGNNNSNHASSGNSGSNGNNNVAPILPTYNNKLVQSCLQDLHGTIRELELKVQLNKENNDDNNCVEPTVPKE